MFTINNLKEVTLAVVYRGPLEVSMHTEAEEYLK